MGYQNFICHLLNLVALALDVILHFGLAAFNNLKPFHLVLQCLSTILYTPTQVQTSFHALGMIVQAIWMHS